MLTFQLSTGVAGACGKVNSDSAYIAAVYTSLYDGGSACGKTITITSSSGTTIEVTVADECPTCGSDNHIDLAEGPFQAL